MLFLKFLHDYSALVISVGVPFLFNRIKPLKID